MPSVPPTLRRLQLGLRDVLTDPRGARAAAAARPEIIDWIRRDGTRDAATRLSVYGDGYFLRMLEALSFDYPAVRRAAGETDFRVLAAGYVEARPSTSPSLADLGEKLPEFAAGHELGLRLPFLADLARLERAVSECLLVDRQPPLKPERLAGIAPEAWSGARLVIDPSARLLKARWPVLGLWRGGTRRPRAPKPQSLLVARHARGLFARALSSAEWDVLRRLQGGAPLGEALSGARQAAARVQRWFAGWTSAGLINDVRVG